VSRRLAGVLLILLMAVGSILLWLGIPVGLVYLASQLSTSSQPSLGLYAALAVAIPGLMILTARGLGRLDAVYARLTGAERDTRYRGAWTRSVRGERGSTRKRTVLDTVMVVSVSLALVVFAIWFFAFAHTSGPG
jgi:hypothetical protein